MKKFKKYSSFDLSKINDRILAYWEENKIFEKSVNNRKNSLAYIFFEGPPSANGQPGIHHVMARTIKDLFCRYKTLQGYKVDRKAGWDTHGLPVELGVEEMLNITKEDIGKSISIKEYNDACRKNVMKYKDMWEKITKEMGYWVNMKDPYVTYDNKYIESVWWLLKKMHQKNVLYKGHTIQYFHQKQQQDLVHTNLISLVAIKMSKTQQLLLKLSFYKTKIQNFYINKPTYKYIF